MKRKYIVGNWKMNLNASETKEFFNEFNNLIDFENLKHYVGFGIPNLNLGLAKKEANPLIKIGAQNVYFEEKGAFTGEISPQMLVSYKTDFVILGHSERRQIFGETSEMVNKKVKAVLKFGMTPIVCVGETLEEYEKGMTNQVVKSQIEKSLATIVDFSKIVIAYEPIWAIGTGKTATPEDAEKVCKYIREITSRDAIIQYGGSVNPSNAKDLMNQPNIDGALVGGASLKPALFSELISSLN